MKLAFIVLAHQRPAQLALLLSSLQHPAARTYLHIDRRARIAPFESEFARHGIAEVELLPRHDSRWGGIGMVDAALEGLGRGLSERCDYFVLLSGQDFPVWPIAETIRFFTERREKSYLEHFALPDWHWAYDGRVRTDFYTYDLFGRRETCFPRGEEPALSLKGRILNRLLRLWTAHKPPRRFPHYVRPFGGSSWWNLSRPAAEFVFNFVQQHPDYRTYHQHTMSADEIFIHSILLGTAFADTHRPGQRFAPLHTLATQHFSSEDALFRGPVGNDSKRQAIRSEIRHRNRSVGDRQAACTGCRRLGLIRSVTRSRRFCVPVAA